MRDYLPFLFALGTAVCWGLYGPTLGKARLADATDLSPFKPYVGIGFAYLVIAIAGGLLGMWYKGDSFETIGSGGFWGVAAGTLGALGAFSLTLCMFNGGARIPHAVMPIVFGGAVTVTALYTVWSSGGELRSSPMLWIGIAGMAASAIVITMNTPHR
ncbi:MAG TPA: hypothetical protein VLK65_03660 [Vicinamibacteria bacterium]|nr:hypothetical protein [Vicinamibacteria bacterium]